MFSLLIIQVIIHNSHESGWEIHLDAAKFQSYIIMTEMLYF